MKWAQDRLEGLEDEFLECRWIKHRWVKLGIYAVPGTRGFIAKFGCSVCDCERYDEFGSDFEIVRRRYKHPSGYLVTYSEHDREKGRRLRRADVTEQIVRRLGAKLPVWRGD